MINDSAMIQVCYRFMIMQFFCTYMNKDSLCSYNILLL
jgi:hypothetical protein